MSRQAIKLIALMIAITCAISFALDLLTRGTQDDLIKSQDVAANQPDGSASTGRGNQNSFRPVYRWGREGAVAVNDSNPEIAMEPTASADTNSGTALTAHDISVKEAALARACFDMVKTDPSQALTTAVDNNLNKDSVLKNLVLQWSEQDLNAAYQWVMARPMDDRRSAMLSGIAYVWSQSDPSDAAGLVVDQIPPGAAQNEAVMMVLHQWALNDPAGAAAWVQQFPEGPLQIRAVNELGGIATYERSLAQTQ